LRDPSSGICNNSALAVILFIWKQEKDVAILVFLIFYIVFGCKSVPCSIRFETIKPSPGRNIRRPAHGLRYISMIGTIVKLII
jgi:hypothetical protein